MTDEDLEQLMTNLESDQVERKASCADSEKIRQAICAFANDLPDHRAPGIIFVGVTDQGECAKLAITDQLLTTLSDMRSDGNITPFPTLTVQRHTLKGCPVAVVLVHPSDFPPVRLRGRTYIRVGPRRAIATVEEERRLSEKRRSKDLPFDLQPVPSATLDDLDEASFGRDYLPSALSREVLDQNNRSLEHQLVALRFLSPRDPRCPTVLGLLVTGKSPADFVPGAYIQFLRFDGFDLNDPIKSQKELHGPLPELLTNVDEVLKANISTATDITAQPVEARYPDYPLVTLQQIVRNAVMHRPYEATHAPVRINWFADRIEIQNPGGPFGQVTCENFGRPGITDYRNPHLAEAMKNLGFVQRFGVGIELARSELRRNGNPPPEFVPEASHVLVILRRRP